MLTQREFAVAVATVLMAATAQAATLVAAIAEATILHQPTLKGTPFQNVAAVQMVSSNRVAMLIPVGVKDLARRDKVEWTRNQ